MISIDQLDDLSREAVAQCSLLKEYCLVSSEAELKDVLRSVKSYPLLVSVHPASQGRDESMDNMSEQNILVFFVLMPLKETFSRAERTQVWNSSQWALRQLKEFLARQITWEQSQFFPWMWDSGFAERTIEPEYNFQGLVGWSLSFDVRTSGL